MTNTETSYQLRRLTTLTEPEPYVNALEPITNVIFKVLGTRAEPNLYHQRTPTEHEPKILRSFPSLIFTQLCRVIRLV